MAKKQEEKEKPLTEDEFNKLRDMIAYSDKYADARYEYRHVTLPKGLFKVLPKSFFDKHGMLTLLSDEQWRAIGVSQSRGWEHYDVHAPEPHVLLFRRPLDCDHQEHHQAAVTKATAPRAVPRGGRNVM